jgi:thioredoxin reductase (NADPH)
MSAMAVPDVKLPTNLLSSEQAQLLLPKLSDEQLATLESYGRTETTTVGQVLATAGDLSYDLLVVLDGEVECSDNHDGARRPLLVHGPRDFIAELDLLTGQRVYANFVVTQAGSVIRVPRDAVTAIIDADGALGELLVQTLFRRREALLLLRSGFQLIGSRYSSDTQRLREVAARNRLAFSWIDLDNDPVALALLHTLGLEVSDTPVVLLGGDVVLVNPSNAELANAAGITEEPLSGSVFDILVVGAGPAGLAAAVYGSSEGLATAVVDAVAPGGQASTTSRIENYLGFPAGVSGAEFGERAQLQAKRMGAEMFVPHSAVSLLHHGGYYHVVLENGAELLGKTVIIATGVGYRGLDVAGIEGFERTGVFYSPSDADHVEPGESVLIVGGGNSAGQAATSLAASGHPVHLIVRGEALAGSMSSYLLDRIEHDSRITVHTQSTVTSVRGDRQLESVVIRDRRSGQESELATHYLFVMIGADPHTAWLDGAVLRDRHGFIPTGDEIPAGVLSENDWALLGRGPYPLETSLPGVFTVGDVRSNSVKRVAAAVGEGSMAVRFAQQYLGQIA